MIDYSIENHKAICEFKGNPFELTIEIVNLIGLVYNSFLKESAEAGETFKDYFLSILNDPRAFQSYEE